MLRPEQMSKVSVTGAKSVMDEVIETMHDVHLVHITDYDGSWDGFEPGESLEGADETSGTLVTVRAIENILGITEDDIGSTASVDLTDAETRLETIRTQVNELDDERDALRSRQREIEEQLDQMAVFADLGIDLDLLWGYDSLAVRVGEGDSATLDAALSEAKDVDAFDVFSGQNSVAVFAQETDEDALEDALVGVPFTEYEVPELSGDPSSNVDELEHELQKIETKLERIENELETIKLENAGFLVAFEEELSVDAQKYEAPLRFATTERSFIVEGWVPTEKYDELSLTLEEDVGERIQVDEIERARYTSGGHVHREHGHGDDHGNGDEHGAQTADTDTEAEVATDGGTTSEVVTVQDDPPVIQNNSRVVSPFEVLTKAVNRPKYSELDPTLLLFLTFPFFFGFMIGDVGYGLLYVLIGYGLYANVDSQGLRDFGMVVVWLGLFTIAFGVLYGELFGLHVFYWLWEPLGYGGELLPKGLTDGDWAITWLLVACLFGWLQLNIGWGFNFIEEWQLHGAKEAIIESGSWLLMLNGIWVWIFSTHLAGNKPDFLVGEEAVFNEATLAVGFTGFPELAGIVGLAAFVLGILLLLSGPWYEVFEALVPLVHVLSYTRLTAVLLSKAGMAVAANLLYFGAYMDDGFQFIHTTTPADHGDAVIFDGVFNMGTSMELAGLQFGLEGALLGIPVLIVGHMVVLAIGGTAALQAIRLEYVEFFGKFYDGGGREYLPFGYERNYT